MHSSFRTYHGTQFIMLRNSEFSYICILVLSQHPCSSACRWTPSWTRASGRAGRPWRCSRPRRRRPAARSSLRSPRAPASTPSPRSSLFLLFRILKITSRAICVLFGAFLSKCLLKITYFLWKIGNISENLSITHVKIGSKFYLPTSDTKFYIR